MNITEGLVTAHIHPTIVYLSNEILEGPWNRLVQGAIQFANEEQWKVIKNMVERGVTEIKMVPEELLKIAYIKQQTIMSKFKTLVDFNQALLKTLDLQAKKIVRIAYISSLLNVTGVFLIVFGIIGIVSTKQPSREVKEEKSSSQKIFRRSVAVFLGWGLVTISTIYNINATLSVSKIMQNTLMDNFKPV